MSKDDAKSTLVERKSHVWTLSYYWTVCCFSSVELKGVSSFQVHAFPQFQSEKMAAPAVGATIVAAETNPRGIPRAAFIVWNIAFILYNILRSFSSCLGRYWRSGSNRTRWRWRYSEEAKRLLLVRLLFIYLYTGDLLTKLFFHSRKYKSVESRSVQNRNILKTKIPEIQRNLEMVEYLKSKSVRAIQTSWASD